MMDTPQDLDLGRRERLPDHLRVLLDALPRDGWESHPNFDGLVKFWLSRHGMFREVLERLRDGSHAYLDGKVDPARHARETGRYAGFLLNELHGHHEIEDHHYFPVLEGLDPRLTRGFELLDRDHQALDGHIHDMAERTNAFLAAVREGDARDPAGRLDAALEGFEGFLNRHLEDEEDLVVPVILTHAPRL